MDVFNLMAKIGLDKSEYESGIESAKGSMSSLAKGVGNGLKTVAKVGAAAVAAGTAGVVALTKMGVEGYAQYEQLVGGVETLFKSSQNIVMGYAENAFRTSGLSANAYMETVTSFSASLIQSLGGDTEKAAQKADVAITDMSDNANKMGSDIESLKVAYAGFAKGQFTLLDNLKLGYGGTQEEMQRLLADAEAISGVKYDISSYADIVDAIHVIQTEMGITGTTAREAATTIEGSLAMMKGAWQNLVVGMADSNANMEVLINNFVESTVTAAQNIFPRIEQTLAGVGQLVEGLAPIIAEKLPAMVESVLPSLITAAVSLVTSLASALPGLLDSLLPVVIQAALDIIIAIVGLFASHGGDLLQTGIDAVLQIVNGISDSMPQIIESAIIIITELVNTLTSKENLDKLLDSAVTLIEAVVIGLIDNLPQLVEAAIQLIENLVAFITDKDNLAKLLDMAVNLIITIVNGLLDALPRLTEAAIQLVVKMVAYLQDPSNTAMLIGAALTIILTIARGLIESSFKIGEGIVALIEEMVGKLEGKDWKEVAEDIIDKLLGGFKTAWKSVTSWFSSAWDALFNKSTSVSTDGSGKVSVKGYATGLDYVPYDNFPAFLHRGEAVLTAAEAGVWRKGQKLAMAGGVTVNQYIQTVPQTPVEFANATEAYLEQARWTL